MALGSLVKCGYWTGPPCWGRRKNVTRPNYFFWDYFRQGANIQSRWMQGMRNTFTFGGSCWDGYMALRLYSGPNHKLLQKNRRFKMKAFMKHLNLVRGPFRPLKRKELSTKLLIKGLANAGPTWIAAGFNTKEAALPYAVGILDAYDAGLIKVSNLPNIMYGMAGRGKPVSLEKIRDKQESSKGVGRAVWMGDLHGILLESKFSVPFTQLLMTTQRVICLGFDKNNQSHVDELLRDTGRGDGWLLTDFETFDGTIVSDLIDIAFGVIEYALSVKTYSRNWKLLQWLKRQFIASRVVCPDRRIYRLDHGVPSGSGFTSIVDSLVNAYVGWRLMLSFNKVSPLRFQLRLLGHKAFGDDGNFTFKRCDEARWYLDRNGHYELLRKARYWCSEYLQKNFFVTLNTEKTETVIDFFVDYKVPRIEAYVADHSRYYLLKKFAKGRKENPKTKLPYGWDMYRVISDENELLQTVHKYSRRFEYVFSRRFKFLGTYFLRSGKHIRPKPEMTARLGNTPASVDTIFQWRALIVTYLIEHWNNLASRAELLSMFLDSFYMQRDGITVVQDLLTNGEFEPNVKTLIKKELSRTYRKTKPTHTENTFRQWWLGLESWWPDITDPKFLWLSEQIQGLFRLMHVVREESDIPMEEMGRLRPVLLLTPAGKKYYFGSRLREGYGRFLDAFASVVGIDASLMLPKAPLSWDYSSSQAALACESLRHLRPPGISLLEAFFSVRVKRFYLRVEKTVSWHNGEYQFLMTCVYNI